MELAPRAAGELGEYQEFAEEHFPKGRVVLENVLRLAIREFGGTPTVPTGQMFLTTLKQAMKIGEPGHYRVDFACQSQL